MMTDETDDLMSEIKKAFDSKNKGHLGIGHSALKKLRDTKKL